MQASILDFLPPSLGCSWYRQQRGRNGPQERCNYTYKHTLAHHFFLHIGLVASYRPPQGLNVTGHFGLSPQGSEPCTEQLGELLMGFLCPDHDLASCAEKLRGLIFIQPHLDWMRKCCQFVSQPAFYVHHAPFLVTDLSMHNTTLKFSKKRQALGEEASL